MEGLTFRQIVRKLEAYWSKRGCTIVEPLDLEVGAGTFHPISFFNSLNNKRSSFAFIQACRRPKDGRYAKNPNRWQKYYQYQVIIKPAPEKIRTIYLKSLSSIGISVDENDIKFVEDNWESPTLGASGFGWEVWLNGLEITQFTYFQQIGGINCPVIPVEITYGLERIATFIQGVNDIKDIWWDNNLTYGDLNLVNEIEFSKYNFELSSPEFLANLFNFYLNESKRLIELENLFPAYEYLIKSSHIFNTLEATEKLSVIERTNYIQQIRAVAVNCAQKYVVPAGKCK